MKPLLKILVPITIALCALTGCRSVPETSYTVPTPMPEQTTPVPDHTPEERARATGERVGQELNHMWQLTKEFSQGIWSELKSDTQ